MWFYGKCVGGTKILGDYEQRSAFEIGMLKIPGYRIKKKYFLDFDFGMPELFFGFRSLRLRFRI